MKKSLAILVLLATLQGCTLVGGSSLEESIGVGPEDNAMQCVTGQLQANGVTSNASTDTKRIELPAWLKPTGEMTMDQVIAYVNALAGLAQEMDCDA